MNHKNDIQAELIQLNSKLADMPKTMPYHVSHTYFEQLTSRATVHASVQKANTYIVPEGYFDNMPEALVEKLKAENNAPSKQVNIISFSWKKISLAVAAIILLLVSIGIYQLPEQQPLTATENLALVPDDAILAYVEDNIDEFDMELIKSTIPSSTKIEATFNQIDNKVINEYLYTPDWE